MTTALQQPYNLNAIAAYIGVYMLHPIKMRSHCMSMRSCPFASVCNGLCIVLIFF